MKNILTVIKKELLRVFKDPRLILVLLMPGLLIYAMYSILGNMLSNSNNVEDETFRVVTVNIPTEVLGTLNSVFLAFELDIQHEPLENLNDDEVNAQIEKIRNNEKDLLLIFDADFMSVINGWEQDSSDPPPNVRVYHNPTDAVSIHAFQRAFLALQIFRSDILEDRDVDPWVFNEIVEEVFDEKSAMAQGFAMFLPFLIISFLLSGCMAITPDSIAGEKERGTIATILITPIKRSHLALGKILALSILSAISAVSSFIGILFSIPAISGGMSLAGLYGFSEYALLFLVLLATVMLITGLMAIISAFAKTVREASMLVTPFMLIAVVIGLLAMTGGGAVTAFALYLIPIYNSVQALISILLFQVNTVNLIITVVSNMVYLGACVFAMTKIFNSERIMFSK
jgi:sodium transport system permease protein